MPEDIKKYNDAQAPEDAPIISILYKEIVKALPGATSKVWHGSPVWFLDGNPIVTYVKRKAGMCLMFWSGQTFDESKLKAEGKFKAAEIFYNDPSEIDTGDLACWLEKSKRIQWDYKNIVKNKGHLERLV